MIPGHGQVCMLLKERHSVTNHPSSEADVQRDCLLCRKDARFEFWANVDSSGQH